jgi:DNA-binding MarR family transcriptional regulator
MDRIAEILSQWNRERPDLDVAPMGLIGRLMRVSRHLAREVERNLAAHGLNRPSFDVLATLRRSGPPYALSPGGLMDSMMVTSGTVTNRIDQLEKAGLVVRRPNPEDGRGFLVALTETGFTVVEQAVATHVATQTRLVAGLTERERSDLDGLLKRFLERLEDPAE